MKPTRRDFIKTITLGLVGSSFIPVYERGVFAKSKEFTNGIEIEKGYKVFNIETQKSMEALAEVLVPGSKAIDIRSSIMRLLENDYGLAGFLDAGFWNLDTISKTKFKKPFYKLESKEQIEAVIKHVSTRNKSFFGKFRKIVIEFYYSNPNIWKRISYSGPPQPKGFMNYQLRPSD